MLLVPSASPFEIYGVSALSLHKKQSSTYNKYACGCFLCAPSIYTVYFKRLTESMFYDMLLLQTVLDVSEPPWTAVVLRSSVFAQQTRRQKMYRTYIFYRACGCFLCAPSICIVYFKRLTEKYALRYAAAENSPRRIRTAMEGGGFKQKRVRLRTRSPRMYRTYIRGRGCPWFHAGTSLFTNLQLKMDKDVHFLARQLRCRLSAYHFNVARCSSSFFLHSSISST